MGEKEPLKVTGKDYLFGLLMTALVAALALAAVFGIKAFYRTHHYGGRSLMDTESGESAAGRTVAAGIESDFLNPPSASPDGRQIAWSGAIEGQAGLYVLPTGGGEPTLVDSAVPFAGSGVAWSEDGRRIVWMAAGDTPDEGTPRVLDLRESAPVALGVETPVSAVGAGGAYWWPDNGSILFVEPQSERLMRLDVAASEPEAVAHGVSPSPGPRPLRIARTRDGIYAFDAVSRHRLGAAERVPLLDWAAVSPDGAATVLVEAPYLANSTVVEVALAPAGFEAAPRYTRGAPQWVETAPAPVCLEWTPDSSRILVYLPRDTEIGAVGFWRDDAKADAAVVDRDTGEVLNLLAWPGEATEHEARWLDDSTVLYTERTDGRARLWLVDRASGKASELLAVGGEAE